MASSESDGYLDPEQKEKIEREYKKGNHVKAVHKVCSVFSRFLCSPNINDVITPIFFSAH